MPETNHTPSLPKFAVDYAEFGRISKCQVCKNPLKRNDCRISKRTYSDPCRPPLYLPMHSDKWYHLKCFEKARSKIVLNERNIDGFEYLKWEDATFLRELIRTRTTTTEKWVVNNQEKELKHQSEVFWNAKNIMKEMLEGEQKKQYEQYITNILNENNQPILTGFSARRNQVTDLCVFGIPDPCPMCQGPLVYSTEFHTYCCRKPLDGYSCCDYTDYNPPCKDIQLPLIQKLEIQKLDRRIYSSAILNDDVIVGHWHQLIKFLFWFFAVLRFWKDERADKIIPNPLLLYKKTSKELLDLIKNDSVSDPKCAGKHVYINNGTKYQASLIYVNLDLGIKKGRILQVLKSDTTDMSADTYYFYNAWRNIDKKTENNKNKNKPSMINERTKEQCESLFCKKYFDLTGNEFSNLPKFSKIYGKYDILEVEYKGKTLNTTSKLSIEVQLLINLIPDTDVMNSDMQEMKIDTTQTNLNNLTSELIRSAYHVLKQITEEIESGNSDKLKGLSNKFYSRMPYTNICEINTLEIVTKKCGELEILKNYGIMNKMFRAIDTEKDPIEQRYEKIGCDIEVLDPNSKEYNLIVNYVKDANVSKYTNYDVVIDHIYEISRKEENEDSYKSSMKKVGNIYLLWHGSQLFNFAGILSNGLRVAPPEVPHTGYMFGKGIYFADMVDKAANYSFSEDENDQPDETIGLLLLSEVALGKMQETKLPKTKPDQGFDSLKGVGRRFFEPKNNIMLPGSVRVPKGKLIESDDSSIHLHCNEYIVYKESQVRLRYLVQTRRIQKEENN